VLWFSEVQRRKLYRDLGFGLLQHYAREALGFSQAKVYQFLRLANALEELPNLRQAMATGEIGWTKARTVASVATPRTEARWVREAKRSSRRQLEQAVRQIKQRARYQALMEKARKQRRDLVGCSREELLLAALEELVAGPAVAATDSSESNPTDHPECTRVHSSTPYQIVVYKCDECGKATVPTAGGERRLSRAEAEAVECDSRILEPGQRNRSTIPPAVRRAVPTRDGHRCRVPGCRHVLFLEVRGCATSGSRSV